MVKKTTPAATVILYILGIIFLAVSAFMLYTAATYNKVYLASFESTFSDMWSYSVQYIIGQFVPYLAAGIICFGLGKAIKEARNSAAHIRLPEPDTSREEAMAAELDRISGRVNYLADDIDATREVLSIKIEEKEKREVVRLNDLRQSIADQLMTCKIEGRRIPQEDLARLLDEAVAAAEQAQERRARIKAPAIMRHAGIMAMPAIERIAPVEAAEAGEAAEVTQAGEVAEVAADVDGDIAFAEAKAVPQIFTQARKMVMPAVK